MHNTENPTQSSKVQNQRILIDARKENLVYKNWRVISRVLNDLGIQYRFNTRLGAFQIDPALCIVNASPIRQYVPPMIGWHSPSDEWDGWFRDYMKSNYLFKGLGAKAKTVPLSFTDTDYYRQIEALCGQATVWCDPLIDYLQFLIWDDTPRLDTLMHTLYGCEQDDKSAWFGRFLFGGVVQRTVDPGHKFDGIPIIAGAQALGKSSFLENMLPGDLQDALFCGSVNLNSRDDETISMCRGRAIVEVGELAGIFGRELAGLKQFVAQRSDVFRPKYGRRHQQLKRTWIIVGTADRKDDILPPDPAGNRRWPVLWLPGNGMTRRDRMKWLEQYRDQLWAEAWHEVYTKGRPIHWTDELQTKYGQVHRDHERRDESLEEKIRDNLNGEWMPLAKIAEEIGLTQPGENLQRKDEMRLATALRNCGYERHKTRVLGVQKKGWVKNTGTVVPPSTPKIEDSLKETHKSGTAVLGGTAYTREIENKLGFKMGSSIGEGTQGDQGTTPFDPVRKCVNCGKILDIGKGKMIAGKLYCSALCDG